MGKNTVELIGYYGSDKTHALSAWTSTNRDLTDDKIKRMPKLLKDLAGDGHHTPFEKSALHFLVTTDIASHIHIIKHRIAVSVNAESARYKELKEDKYYLPEDWNGIKVSDNSNKILDDDIEHNGNMNWVDVLEWYTKLGNKLYHNCLNDLTESLGRKRAKETARFFKAYNSQITADVQFNFRSFMAFQKLRNHEHSQKEIREIAQEMLRLVKETGQFKYSLEAFGW